MMAHSINLYHIEKNTSILFGNAKRAEVGSSKSYYSLTHLMTRAWHAIQMAYLDLCHCLKLPSSLPRKYVILSSRNLAHPDIVARCLATKHQPISKDQYAYIGHDQGLRLTYDLSLPIDNGLCLGMSLAFLMNYNNSTHSAMRTRAIEATKPLERGATFVASQIQAIYDGLLGMKVSNSQIKKNQDRNTKKSDLTEIILGIKTYLEDKGPNGNPVDCRRYVLNYLEHQGVEVSPESYVLMLELIAKTWQCSTSPNGAYQELHSSILKATAEHCQLDYHLLKTVKGNFENAKNELISLGAGTYLIHLPKHTIALIKNAEGRLALFDANAGLAELSQEQQSEALESFLKYYFPHKAVTIKIAQV